MNTSLLKINLSKLEKEKIKLIKYWIGNIEVLTLLKRHNIDIEFFVKNFALGVIDYYFGVIEGKYKIGQCPTIRELLKYLSKENVKISELFIICNGFKNSLVDVCFDLNIVNSQLFKELDFIYEKNFSGVLDEYTTSIINIKNKLHKSSDIIDKYVITSKISTDGTILDVSEAFSNKSGFTKEELINKNNNILNHMNMPEDFISSFWKNIKSNDSWQGEIKNLSKDGSNYWLDTIISPHKDENGKIVYLDTISQDITSKKKLEEQQKILIEQSKLAAMGEMISMIAHQWRQPLQAVSILSHKLLITKTLEGDLTTEFIEDSVESIGKQLDYMSNTIDNFRDFFLPNKAKEKIDIETLLNKALDFVSFMIKNDSITVNIDKKTDRKIQIFTNEIIQVLINIIKNARDVFIERKVENKIISISYYEIKDYICIVLEDNAGGINEDIKEKIFEPYFSTKSEKNGTGLGLYMCKIIVEKHSNGVLSLENSRIGAKFIIKLPITP